MSLLCRTLIPNPHFLIAVFLLVFGSACRTQQGQQSVQSHTGSSKQPAPQANPQTDIEAGHPAFSRQDTLKGSLTPERRWWDVVHYDIAVEPDFDHRTIRGLNLIRFRVLSAGSEMQIDLQQPLQIRRAWIEASPDAPQNAGSLLAGLLSTANNALNRGGVPNNIASAQGLPMRREGNAWFVKLPRSPSPGEIQTLAILYEGTPSVARQPPWDGGWIWARDSRENHWVSVACQTRGASSWYPCKDHQSDEPDSATLWIIIPEGLRGVGNGRPLVPLRQVSVDQDHHTRVRMVHGWKVVSPINSYNIVPYIGDYTNWSDTLHGEAGVLDLSYYVLREKETEARRQFRQMPDILRCFEHWFGPYPFYADGFKLVHAPHLGMEHQSAIAYGNGFANGYKGRDLSGTGWGLQWDFILVHETGHEWFGNSITTRDIADMWVHEGFTNYSEVLYTEWKLGKAAGEAYCIGLRENIRNDVPVIGVHGVHKTGSGDMYFKAANLVHMIRQIVDDDARFRGMLRAMNSKYRHQTVTGAEIEKFLSEQAGRNLQKIFDQYLRDIRVPVLEYRARGDSVEYHWTNCVPGFDMPLRITGQKPLWIYPREDWQAVRMPLSAFRPDPNFYVEGRKL